MLTTQAEFYFSVLPEMARLYPDHWRELAADSDIPLAPRYEAYAALAVADQILVVTLRDDGVLAGYFMGFILPELHYETCLSCTGDIFYISPAYRRSQNGVKLFRQVEVECRKRHVQRWHVTSKLKKDCGALLRRIGFTAVEMHYSKRLD